MPPSGLHDMRIAPRERLPQLEQMIDPPPPVTRWTSRRKAAVVAAVHSGEITLEAACGRYELSIEEFPRPGEQGCAALGVLVRWP